MCYMWENQISCALLSEIFSRPCLLFVWIFSTASYSSRNKSVSFFRPIFKIAIRDKFTGIKLTHISTARMTNLILKLLGAESIICVKINKTKMGELVKVGKMYRNTYFYTDFHSRFQYGRHCRWEVGRSVRRLKVHQGGSSGRGGKACSCTGIRWEGPDRGRIGTETHFLSRRHVDKQRDCWP